MTVSAADLSIRPKNFIVTPSTGPVAEVIVQNNGTSPYSGTVTPTYPEGWQVAPLSQKIDLPAGESTVLSFAVEKGLDRKANIYPVSVNADGTEPVKADVVCASTPYYKPKIDGKLDEWADAIPVAFETGGKKTTVRSYWSRQNFCLAVEVEEDELTGLKNTENGLDAIQFSLAPNKAQTPTEKTGTALRYEYVVADSGSFLKGDKCFQLMSYGDTAGVAQETRDLGPLELKDAEVKVKHKDGVTRYEVAIPMRPMLKRLRATAGREYRFSLLVHDNGKIRDLGTVMNLWPCDRNPLAWCKFNGAAEPAELPFDNKVEFGFCSSIH